MTYTFARGTRPRPVPDRVELPKSVRLPKATINTDASTFELGDRHRWVVVKLQQRGHIAEAGLLLLPGGNVWLDAAGEQAIAAFASSQRGLAQLPNGSDLYRDAVLSELATLAFRAAADHERAQTKRSPRPKRPRPRATRLPSGPESLAEVLELDRRVGNGYTISLEGSVLISIDAGDLVFASEFEDDDKPLWHFYLLDHDDDLLEDGWDITTVEEARPIVDRWVGALDGEFALTLAEDTKVRRRDTGELGEIIGYVAPQGDRPRSYVVEWANGSEEEGLFDSDVEPQRA